MDLASGGSAVAPYAASQRMGGLWCCHHQLLTRIKSSWFVAFHFHEIVEREKRAHALLACIILTHRNGVHSGMICIVTAELLQQGLVHCILIGVYFVCVERVDSSHGGWIVFTRF